MAEPYHVPPALGLVDPALEPSPGDATRESREPVVPSSQLTISETLEELAREGARRMLERALHSEVDAYLGRRRYDRVEDDFSGYRNGYGREREISIGTWAVEVRPPRVADTPVHIPQFRSSILPRGRAAGPALATQYSPPWADVFSFTYSDINTTRTGDWAVAELASGGYHAFDDVNKTAATSMGSAYAKSDAVWAAIGHGLAVSFDAAGHQILIWRIAFEKTTVEGAHVAWAVIVDASSGQVVAPDGAP